MTPNLRHEDKPWLKAYDPGGPPLPVERGDPHLHRIKTSCRPGPGPTQAELIAYCGEKLAMYKLPKSNVGKVLRKDLGAMEAAKSGQRRAS